MLDPGAEIEAGEGCLLGAGSSNHPTISNAAFRTDDGLDPAELLARARDFFGGLGRGFGLWVRDGVDEDGDLIAAAESAGLRRRLRDAGDGARRPRRGARASRGGRDPPARDPARRRASTGGSPPPPTRASAFRPRSSSSTRASRACRRRTSAAFLGYLDGTPVSIAMTLRQPRRRRHLLGRQPRGGARQGARPGRHRCRDQRRLRPRCRPRLAAGLADGEADLRGDGLRDDLRLPPADSPRPEPRYAGVARLYFRLNGG